MNEDLIQIKYPLWLNFINKEALLSFINKDGGALNIGFWNVNSTNSKQPFLQEYIEDYDIFGLVETWGKEEYPPLVMNTHYCVHKNRKTNGGGVAFMIKKTI